MGWKGSLIELPVWALGRLHSPRFDPARTEPREILVLRPNDFGDLLTTTPLFQALRLRFPSARLIAGVGRWGRPVLENNPFVDEIVEIDAPWNNKVVRDQSLGAVVRYIWNSDQVAALRQRDGYDIGIDVLGSHVGLMLMLRAGVRYRIGVRGYRGGWSGCQSYIDFSRYVHVSRAALAQAELLGATVLPEPRPQLYLIDSERKQAEQLWRAGASPEHKPLRLLVGCAAGIPEKSWSAQALGKALREIALSLDSADEKIDIVIVGSPADEAKAAQIIAASGLASGIRSMAGQTSLRVTFALAEAADIVLTNPSMLLHVAAAFRRPTVAVLGGTFADPKTHDTVWGYPPPYSSVGPLTIVPDVPAANWPTVEQVVQAVLLAVGQRVRGRSEIG